MKIIENNKNNSILITGCAGFIGYHLAKTFLGLGYKVIGIDSLNDYYQKSLKIDRLKDLGIEIHNNNEIIYRSKDSNFSFFYCDLFNSGDIEKIFNDNQVNIVFHFAAQAGVRYGLINPESYIKNNLNSFFNILDISRKHKVSNFYYASSSSIYGNSTKDKFSESDFVDNPISLYAATKKSNELIAHSYSSIYGIKTIGLRFFTVYGPWGRPDMAYFDFTKKIMHNQEIVVYNRGDLIRDFTYIDDVIQAILLIMNNNNEIYNTYNIANGNPIKLSKFIDIIENALNIKAKIKYLEIEAGDVFKTSANIEKIKKFGFKPINGHQLGVYKFIEWYKNYYN